MRQAHLSTARAVALGSLLTCAACGAEPPSGPVATGPSGEVLTLVSMTPAANSALHAGQTVTFTATLRYTLVSGETGTVSMHILDQFGRKLQPDDDDLPTVPVTRGSGTLTLDDTVTLPPSGVTTVAVFFPLSWLGMRTSDVAVTVRYPVS